MLTFPNCKINLGLHVVARRPDNFHNIETVFYPVRWCDALEIIENTSNQEHLLFTQSGLRVNGSIEQNLIYKAWKLISSQRTLPNLKVHLHKNLPMGAGLGGGSSDAAAFITMLNDQFALGFTESETLEIASHLGSDCAFFIKNKPVFATGKGNEFSDITIDLENYFILVVYPDIHSNTKEAYEGLAPKAPAGDLRNILNKPVKEWKHLLVNDFETTILKKYPAIHELKNNMYASGALYASLSGSGSAVFGIFEKEPQISLSPLFKSHLQKPASKIL